MQNMMQQQSELSSTANYHEANTAKITTLQKSTLYQLSTRTQQI